MPTFSEIENQKQGGMPILLVTITHDGQVWRFCGSEFDITVAGETYAHTTLKIDDIKVTPSIQSDDITITLPRSVPISGLLYPKMTRKPIAVEIRQTHEGASDAPFLFKGRAVTAALSETRTEVSLTAKDLFWETERGGARRKWQHGCPLVLYGHQCRATLDRSSIIAKAAPAGFTLYAEIRDPNTSGDTFRGRNISLPEERAFLNGSSIMVNGKRYECERAPTPSGTPAMPRRYRFYLPTADVQEIVAHLNTLPEEARFVTVIPDCERTIRCCEQIHRNNHNFGGQPDLPYESPIGKSRV